jgi:nucleoside phosphorylase
VTSIPLYFSHSYRRADREINAYFWRAFHDAGFSFTVDPETTSIYTTALELMMARSVGFAAVVTFREEVEVYQCSPFIMYEYRLAVDAHQPRIVVRDRRVPRRHFSDGGTLQVVFDAAVLDRCADELEAQLGRLQAQTFDRLAVDPSPGSSVGVAMCAESDAGEPSASARRHMVETFLNKRGYAPVDLAAAADDPWRLSQAADACDFAVIDVDNDVTSRIADFLLGRGVPLLKMANRNRGPITPQRLLGSELLRAAAGADELVMYWNSESDFESKVHQYISQATANRIELTNFDDGRRYFRSQGRSALPVFLSNATTDDELAKNIASALRLDNIAFFHYRYQNSIPLGGRWADELGRMVESSGIFVPLVDAAYWASPYCRREYDAAVRLARTGRITILPILLDGHEEGPEIPYQGRDLRGRPQPEQVALIVDALDDLLASPRMITEVATSGPVVAGQASVDVAIITILPEEYQAVLQLLRRVRTVIGSRELDNQHAWIVGEVDSPTASVPYSVALAMSPRAGTNAAVIATKNTLQAFDPGCVLVVGVAGGFGDLNLGDVVVADRICAYEYGKIDDGFRPRHDLDSPTDAAVVSAARTLSARYPDWYEELAHSGEPVHHAPKIVVGEIASGDKVVDDPTDDFFASVLRSRPKIQAVEMEGAGAAAAIQDAREMQRAVSFGMIRGISDLPRAGGSQPPSEHGVSGQTAMRDSWKLRASVAAATTAIQLIRLSWPRPPRAELSTPATGRIV